MIRYVLAALLTVALIVLAVPAIDRGATVNTERQVDTSLSSIDDEATALIETEEVTPDGHPDPQRIVTVSLPRSTLTTAGVDHFELVPHENGSYTHARYVLEDGATREAVIDERIVWNDPDGNETTEMGGSGDQRLALVLLEDEHGEPRLIARHV
ncbi:hypothetical protein GS429_14580 [Natronorubrum sp. JWXQ-INN-674]|uniref:DUF7311 domain-containing protein n=1 Tax=Natronorubrum halalkaliphilum TaxID=2691917 RepID=A0A6B0VRY5_9EURY|nr:hypothetical protein [Natronorubrum halalkaliphilum]MXV63269.1 hypothetical protein [Natronorubrum halalkaliphilum]